MFSAALQQHKETSTVVMLWETEFADRIFKKGPMAPAPLLNLSSTWVSWEPPCTTSDLPEPDVQAVFSQVEDWPFCDAGRFNSKSLDSEQ